MEKTKERKESAKLCKIWYYICVALIGAIIKT